MLRFDPRTAGVPPLPAALAAPAAPPLRRPRLLARAARAGAALYRRDRDLPALLPGFSAGRRAADLIARLSLLEADCEARRRAQAPDYAVRRHVLALSALLAERAAREAA